MRLRYVTICIVLLLFMATATYGQEGGMPPMGPPEELKALSFMSGEWKIENKWRMGPEAEWQTSEASATYKAILGGAAIQEHFKGTMMGMPFEGMQLLTYDREEKRYESIWIDSMGARTAHTHGQYKDGELVMEGEDLRMGQPYKMRMTSEKRSDDEIYWTMEMSHDGENWFTSMEMIYTRKSS